MPDEVVFKQMKKIMTDFLWDKKRAKVAYDTLARDVSKGGCKLVDIKNKRYCIKMYLDKKNPE